MTKLENVDFTEHAIYRYCQRIKYEPLVNLNSYKIFAKSDKDLIGKYTEEMNELLSNSTFIIQGAFDKNNTKSNFYLNKEHKIVFVLTTPSDKLITLYKVDYGFGDTVNTITMNSLLKEIDKILNKKEKFILKNSSDLEQKEMSIVALNVDIESMKAKINMLENKKLILEKELEDYTNEVKDMTSDIISKANAVVHSIGYKFNDEF